MKKWHISPNIVLREEADEWGILFDPDTGNSVALNPIAIVMFKAMQKSQQYEDVEAAIREKYDEVPKSLEEDVVELLKTLSQSGFIGFEND